MGNIDPRAVAFLLDTGGKIVSDLAHIAVTNHFSKIDRTTKIHNETSRPAVSFTEIAPREDTENPQQEIQETTPGTFEKPSTQETIDMLEGRLNESLIALQPDLLDGARINGKPCDCLKKHTDEMLAAVHELQSMKSKPIYGKIRAWSQAHNWTANKVAQHPPEFFVELTPELRALRKELAGSEPEQAKIEALQPDCPLCEKVKSRMDSMQVGPSLAKKEIPSDTKTILSQIREMTVKMREGKLSREDAIAKTKELLRPKLPEITDVEI